MLPKLGKDYMTNELEVIRVIKTKRFMTFDCYGTLIDWETGILKTIRPILNRHSIKKTDEEILGLFAAYESELEQGEFINYKNVLKKVMRKFFNDFQITPKTDEEDALVNAIKLFTPFPDTIDSLSRLGQRYELGVISNADSDIFKNTLKMLKIKIPFIILSENIGSYKPSKNNFLFALKFMNARVGITTVRVNRSNRRSGHGATPKSSSSPKLVVDDLNMLADLIESS